MINEGSWFGLLLEPVFMLVSLLIQTATKEKWTAYFKLSHDFKQLKKGDLASVRFVLDNICTLLNGSETRLLSGRLN